MFLIHVEEEYLSTALGWVQAFVFSSALEEAANIIGANPVTLAGGFQELLAVGPISAADYTGFRHNGVEKKGSVGEVRS